MNMFDVMTVDVPEGYVRGMRVERFHIGKGVEQFRMAMSGRGTPEGTYTRLMEGDRLWMSDTHAEKRDHMGPVWKIRDTGSRRVLINGLGLGMVLKAALSFDHVEHVDVVERDDRVIELVGPHYLKDSRVRIHHADAYEQTKKWPAGTKWDIGWSDIWADPSTDDLKGMAVLNRSYGRRCGWHGCWFQEVLAANAAQEKRASHRFYM